MDWLGAVEQVAHPIIGHFAQSLIPGVAVALFLTLFFAFFRSINASTRHWLWLTALVVVLLLPITNTINLSAFGEIARGITPFAREAHQLLSNDNASSQSGHTPGSTQLVPSGEFAAPPNFFNYSPVFLTPPAVEISEAQLVTNSADNEIQQSTFSISLGAVMFLFFIWAFVAITMIIKLIGSFFGMHRVKQRAFRANAKVRSALNQIRPELKAIRYTKIKLSNEVQSPMALGIANPMILIPVALAETLSKEELQDVLLHEIGHIKRYDDWSILLQKVIQAVLFFHPAIWWIGRRLDLDREVACDDFVISVKAERRRDYAASLIKVAHYALGWQHRVLQPASRMAETKIETRVKMILDEKRHVSTHVYGSSLVVFLGLLLGFAVATMSLSPSIPMEPLRSQNFKSETLPVEAELVAEIPEDTYIYWFNALSSDGPDVIQRTDLDRNSVENAFIIDRHSSISMLPIDRTYKYGKPGNIGVVENRLYWSDLADQTIKSANLDGTDVQTLIASPGEITAFEVDPIDLKLYWAESNKGPENTWGSLMRMNLNGSAVEVLQSQRGPITDFEIDYAHHRMFWIENQDHVLNENSVPVTSQGGIYRSSLNGGRVTKIKASFNPMTSLTLDEANEIVYWAQSHSEYAETDIGLRSSISRITMDGYEHQVILEFAQGPSDGEVENALSTLSPIEWSGVLGPFDLELDEANNKLYWSMLGTEYPKVHGKIQRASTTGEYVEDVIVRLPNPVGISLVKHQQISPSSNLDIAVQSVTPNGGPKLYWVEKNTSPVVKHANLDGSSVQPIFTPSMVDDDYEPHQGCPNVDEPLMLEVYRGQILHKTNHASLGSVNIQTNQIQSHFFSELGLAEDKFRYVPMENSVYGIVDNSTQQSSDIVKASLNDSSSSQLIVREFGGWIDQFVVDTRNQKIYWSVSPREANNIDDRGLSLIKRANLDGSELEELIWLQSRLTNLEIDMYDGVLFIRTLADINSPHIRRIDASSAAVFELPRIEFSTKSGGTYPCIFKIDSINRKLYLLDSTTGTIASSNLNGSDVRQILTGLDSPYALALDIQAQRVSINDSQAVESSGGGGP